MSGRQELISAAARRTRELIDVRFVRPTLAYGGQIRSQALDKVLCGLWKVFPFEAYASSGMVGRTVRPRTMRVDDGAPRHFRTTGQCTDRATTRRVT